MRSFYFRRRGEGGGAWWDWPSSLTGYTQVVQGNNEASGNFIQLQLAYIVRREVMFAQVSDCSTLGGGYLPWLGGYLPWWGYLPWPGGTYLGRGVPTLAGGTYLGWSVPTLARGYPTWAGMGYPQPEDLLHSGRYASCIHAGGLSCFICLYENFMAVRWRLSCSIPVFHDKQICKIWQKLNLILWKY